MTEVHRFTPEQVAAFGITQAEMSQPDVEVEYLTLGMQAIRESARKPLPWAIQQTLLMDSLHLFYGPPKEMKTFVAIDMAMSQVTGLPFLGTYEVLKKGLVVYCAGEGISGIGQRIEGWMISRGIPEEDRDSLPLRRTRGAIQVNGGGAIALALEVERILEANPDVPLVGVYIDTLARNFGEGDENSTRDMSSFVTECDRHLKERFKCAVVIVHHSGHNETSRPRGAIALIGAVDGMTRVSLDNGKVNYQPDIMKDAEIPPPHYLSIEEVPLGFADQFGSPVNTLTLGMTDLVPNEKAKLSRDADIALALVEGKMDFEDWRAEWMLSAKELPQTRGPNKGKKRDKDGLRKAWGRAVDMLEKGGLILVERDKARRGVTVELAGD